FQGFRQSCCWRQLGLSIATAPYLLRGYLLGNRWRRTPAATPAHGRFDSIGEQRGDGHLHRRGLGADDPIHCWRYLSLPRRRDLVIPSSCEREAQGFV